MLNGTDRYARIAKRTMAAADGRVITYLSRPILPQPSSFVAAQTVSTKLGSRPDLLAAEAFGDPMAFWIIADANTWLNPFSLTTNPGTSVVIPTPGP